MKFTQIPTDTFKTIQLNAGILMTTFDPATATVSSDNMLGATSGGVNFKATPTYSDFGEDIDNCPKNTKELKKIESWEITLGGTMVTIKADLVKSLIAAADVSSTKITPRVDLLDTDFSDLWWVGDYSDVNTGDTAGFVAIHLINALSTDGFQIQSSDKAKGQFAFTYTAHFSIEDQDTVPCEVYVQAGTAAA